MTTRARPSTQNAPFHGSFDPGVTGRRTGIAPPANVRRTSNGIEAFSDYFASPRKDPSVSPIKSPSKPSKAARHAKNMRSRHGRPDLFHEIGERGRKTGISPPANAIKDANGFEQFDTYLIKASEQTNKERRRSVLGLDNKMRRKESVATFVDDGDDDEDFDDDSMSMVTQELDAFRNRRSHSGRPSLAAIANGAPARHSLDSHSGSIRTLRDSELIDFDAAPGVLPTVDSQAGLSNHYNQSMPMDLLGDQSDDGNNDGGGGGDYDCDNTPERSKDRERNVPATDGPVNEESIHGHERGLEDVPEEDEEAVENVEISTNGALDRAGKLPSSKPFRRNSNPPPIAGEPRRSSRKRFGRLEYWRNERVVLGCTDTPDGSQRVIGVLEVVRVPSEPPEPLSRKRSRRGTSRRLKSESVGPGFKGPDPEEGWDSKTKPTGVVFSYTKNRDCQRTVACTKSMFNANVEDGNGQRDTFQFQRVCRDLDYVAGGLLFIPVGGGKPLKPAKDNFYIFTVLEGAVEVHIHRTTFVVAPQGMFFVPRGNFYSITNISARTAKLTFAQARRAGLEEAELESDEDDEEQSIDGDEQGNYGGKKTANRQRGKGKFVSQRQRPDSKQGEDQEQADSS